MTTDHRPMTTDASRLPFHVSSTSIHNRHPTSPVRGGLVAAVEPGSLADALGVRPGDELLAVNGHPVQDVIDVQFYAAEEYIRLRLRRRSNESEGISQPVGHKATAHRRGAENAEETLTTWPLRPCGENGQGQFEVAGWRDYAQPLGLEFAHPTFDVDIRRCNNQCAFCFVRQMPPGMRRSLYVKDDDYRYSFLFGHYVTLTNLTQADWKRIEQQHLSPLYVSVHATPLSIRRKLLGNPNAPDVLKQLRRLARHDIQVHTQLVITPGLNDGDVMERSVFDLAKLYPAVQSVSIVPVGITRYHRHGQRPNTPAEMKIVLKSIHAWQKQFKQQLGVRFVYATDEWYLALGRRVPPRAYYDGLQLQENGLGLTREFLEEWKVESGKLTTDRRPPTAEPPLTSNQQPVTSNQQPATSNQQPITLVTGTLFAPTLRQAADGLSAWTGVKIEVIPIVNHHFGETVTVAGLLTARDVIEQLRRRELGQRVFLPRIMFDHPTGVSLDDLTPEEVARAIGRPVTLAETMGKVIATISSGNAA